MLDINLLRNDPEKVRENIRKKFQDQKLPLVDEVIRFDREYRDAQQQADGLRNKRKTLSKQIGALIGQGKKDEAEAVKAEVAGLRPRRTILPRWISIRRQRNWAYKTISPGRKPGGSGSSSTKEKSGSSSTGRKAS